MPIRRGFLRMTLCFLSMMKNLMETVTIRTYDSILTIMRETGEDLKDWWYATLKRTKWPYRKILEFAHSADKAATTKRLESFLLLKIFAPPAVGSSQGSLNGNDNTLICFVFDCQCQLLILIAAICMMWKGVDFHKNAVPTLKETLQLQAPLLSCVVFKAKSAEERISTSRCLSRKKAMQVFVTMSYPW